LHYDPHQPIIVYEIQWEYNPYEWGTRMNMKIETEDLIIRNFELEDEKDLCEYMLQRVNAEFESYPNFTLEKAKEEILFRTKSES
jgi:hypothetical protein